MSRIKSDKVNKLLLLLILSLGFIGSSHADALCNDGWISKSSGSGTCSWHGGVKKWLNKKNNKKETSDKYIEEIYDLDNNGSIGKCKGTYKQKKICRNRRSQIQQEFDEMTKDAQKYQNEYGDSIKSCNSSACVEKILDELLKDL